ncbi:hypothetical protein Tco_0617436 [Tanacetum coccineum]
MTKRCAQYEKDFVKLEARWISLKLKSPNKSLTSGQNGHVVSDKSDKAKIKFDTEDLETINIELEFSVASLLNENEHLKKIYQNLSREKNILFGNETSSFETKIKELEMTSAQQTKDFEDAKVDFSKKTDKLETYFEKLKNVRVFLERQLDRKIQDSKAEKEHFLKQIASLESKLASQDLISNQKEYNELGISYNALTAKFDALNQEKGKSPMSNFSTPKISVSPKVYTCESSKSFPNRVSQFTTYSLQKDRKFFKKPQVLETPTSQKVFKSSDSSRKKQVFDAPNSRFTPVKQV